ncbi:MAG TPA: LCP family protein [Bacilli bacterium]|nr:LCP family protein [Bacilli bacterium]
MTYTGKQYVTNTKQPPPPKKPKRKIRWGRLFLLLLLFCFVLTITGAAGYGFYLERKIAAEPSEDAAALDPAQPINLLLIGLDSDPNATEETRRTTMNADTLILATIQADKKKASLITLPGNTRIQLSTGPNPLSAAYAVGGFDQLKQSVEQLTGVTVDRYAMVDFPAFRKAIDSLGGIPFELDRPVTDPEGHVHLQAGKRTLSGQEALAVVRFRQDGQNGTTRPDRQQRFLNALLATARRSHVIDWLTSIRNMSDTFRTDMTISEMGTLATALQQDDAVITTDTAPGVPLNLYGASYWKVDDQALLEIVEQAQH